ncbi:MAG: thioredoxin domain-containing protein [Phenylobacterium sp.]
MPSRRTWLATAAAALLAGQAAWAAPAPRPDDMSMGAPNAKVQVIEYASVACPHCAHFNEAVFADFKKRWVDTGKVRFTLKEMLVASPTVAAAGFMMARCAGPSKYFKVVDEIYRSQPRWEEGRIKPILLEIATANGLSEAQFEACLSDQAVLAAINERMRRALEDDGVDSTPTIFINGVKADPTPMTPAAMDAAIEAAMKAAGAPADKTPTAKKGAR